MTNDYPRWHVPIRVEDVPDAGLHLEFVADEAARAGIAALAGVREVARLEVATDVSRRGSGLHASGRMSATVGQTCVVTLEPLETQIEEAFEVTFAPSPEPGAADAAATADEPPEPMVDGVADIGAVATEYLLLGIDPYPRKPGAVFAAPVRAPSDGGAFAALTRLKLPNGDKA